MSLSPLHTIGLRSAPACSCGVQRPHQVARRHAFGGELVALWSDGWVIARDDAGVTRYARTPTLAQLWRVADMAALYEVARLFAVVHWAGTDWPARLGGAPR